MTCSMPTSPASVPADGFRLSVTYVPNGGSRVEVKRASRIQVAAGHLLLYDAEQRITGWINLAAACVLHIQRVRGSAITDVQ